jgi:hypothetical protein
MVSAAVFIVEMFPRFEYQSRKRGYLWLSSVSGRKRLGENGTSQLPPSALQNHHTHNNFIQGCIQIFPEVDNEINKNKHSLRSNTKGYGGKTYKTDSQNSDTTALSDRELYHLQFSLQAASPETFGYTLVSYSTPQNT